MASRSGSSTMLSNSRVKLVKRNGNAVDVDLQMPDSQETSISPTGKKAGQNI